MVYELFFSYYDQDPENDEEMIIAAYSSYEKAESARKKLLEQPRNAIYHNAVRFDAVRLVCVKRPRFVSAAVLQIRLALRHTPCSTRTAHPEKRTMLQTGFLRTVPENFFVNVKIFFVGKGVPLDNLF